ncbi:MAG: biotin transporter BioY [Eubacteriales bacterium]
MKYQSHRLRYIILAALFAGLMAISAWFKIPLPPTMTPVTLQVMFVLFAGLMLPPVYAFASQAVYVLIGLVGLPVFTEGGGFAYVLKPTFGFLLGFILAAWFIAVLVKRFSAKKVVSLFLIALAGVAIIYIIGVPYGYVIFNHVLGADWTLTQVITAFCTLYLPLDILKAVIAAIIAFAVQKRIRIS